MATVCDYRRLVLALRCPLGAVLYSPNEPSELHWLCHNVSVISIVSVITVGIITRPSSFLHFTVYLMIFYGIIMTTCMQHVRPYGQSI